MCFFLFAGQRLRISIYDFNIQPNGEPTNPQPQSSLICYKYGLLLEPHHRKSIDICAGNQREMLTYESKGETVHLTISRPGHSYMVKYKGTHFSFGLMSCLMLKVYLNQCTSVHIKSNMHEEFQHYVYLLKGGCF